MHSDPCLQATVAARDHGCKRQVIIQGLAIIPTQGLQVIHITDRGDTATEDSNRSTDKEDKVTEDNSHSAKAVGDFHPTDQVLTAMGGIHHMDPDSTEEEEDLQIHQVDHLDQWHRRYHTASRNSA